MPASLKQALADSMINIISDHAAKIPDHSPNKCDGKISLHESFYIKPEITKASVEFLLQVVRDFQP